MADVSPKWDLRSGIPMGFFPTPVWVMWYYRFMGYGVDFPAYQLGNTEFLWVIPVYGLRGAWYKRVSTVT